MTFIRIGIVVQANLMQIPKQANLNKCFSGTTSTHVRILSDTHMKMILLLEFSIFLQKPINSLLLNSEVLVRKNYATVTMLKFPSYKLFPILCPSDNTILLPISRRPLPPVEATNNQNLVTISL